MNLGQGERVTFKCTSTDDVPVFISGNIYELGSWNPANALAMQRQESGANHHEWTAQVVIQHGQTIEFKFVKKNAADVRWEGGDNRRYTVIPGQHTLQDHFRN